MSALKSHLIFKSFFLALFFMMFFLLSGCGDDEPHQTESASAPSGEVTSPETSPAVPLPIADIRPVDPSKAVDISESPYKVIPNELLVLLRKETDLTSFAEKIGAMGIKVVGSIPYFNIAQVEVPEKERESYKKRLSEMPDVILVTYQSLFQAPALPNDPVFHNDDPRDDWGLKAIKAPEAWEITRGSKDVIIAVVDAGVQLDHEELVGRIVMPASVHTDDGSHVGDAELLTHGTHVAITAAGSADNDAGTSGVAPECLVMPIQVGFSKASALAGIAYAVENGARIINVSMGPTLSSYYLDEFRDPKDRDKAIGFFLTEMRSDMLMMDRVFSAAEASGAVVVVAAGNELVPADFNGWTVHPFSLGVGAATKTEDGRFVPTDFTNYGLSVRIAAPGSDILSGQAAPGGKGYGYMSGTSMAAPHISGVAALVASEHPEFSSRDIREVIIATANPTPLIYTEASDRDNKVWEKAMLRLIDAKDNHHPDGMVLLGLISILPMEAYAPWDGVYPPRKGLIELDSISIGPLVDAHAALVGAKDTGFRKRFLHVDDKQFDAILKIAPEDLKRVHSLLAIAGKYNNGPAPGGPFSLVMDSNMKSLRVERESLSGKDYSERFEYLAPGDFQHSAELDGISYSQGTIAALRIAGNLAMRTNTTGKVTTYPALADNGTPSDAGGTGFCAIPGACSPTTKGTLLVSLTSMEGTDAAQPYSLFLSGTKHNAKTPVKPVASGHTGTELQLMAGAYQLVIPTRPSIVVDPVVVPPNETIAVNAGGYGRLLVVAKSPDGVLLKETCAIYTKDNPHDSILTGSLNSPLSLLAGVYTVAPLAAAEKKIENVIVRPGEETVIELEQQGTLLVQRLDVDGKISTDSIHINKPGSNTMATYTSFGHPKALAAGKYDLKIFSVPTIEIPGIDIRPGEQTLIEIPQQGAILVTGKDPLGEKIKSGVTIYRGGDRNKSLRFADAFEPEGVQPGQYDISVDLKFKEWFSNVTVRSGETATLEVPQRGRLAPKVVSSNGKNVLVHVYKDREAQSRLVGFWMPNHVDLPPGTYVLDLNLKQPKEQWPEIEIKAGETLEYEIKVD